MTNKITPDSTATITFLQRWAPEGPWVLTAIKTDRKGIDTKTFRPCNIVDLRTWLDIHNGQRNIYFHVNPPLHDLTKKAEREDIASVDWLHIDIDPRAGEDIEEDRKRALGLLSTNLPKGVPTPTVVIFSGGGYQGFWRLEEGIEIGGNLPKAEDAKRYNVQLELLFGADNCHNIDRIMRLPGTVNIPDARKIKKGRIAVLATLVEFNDLSYPVETFLKAPEVQLAGDTTFGGSGMKIDVKISGNIERIDDTSELDKWDVPDRVKVIMGQGKHPDQSKEGDNSRSAWLFDFVCQLVRQDVPDQIIFSIITDPDWPISASVVEMGGNAEKYALKQIASAKEFVIDPWLKYFNEKYAVIKDFGGKCLVVSDRYDHSLKRHRLSKQTLENLEKGYENKDVIISEAKEKGGSPKTKPAGKWWRHHGNRKQFDAIAFAPEQVLPPEIYNMWRGFAVESKPGNCDLFLAHLRDNVTNENEEHYNYLIGWMARTVQKPDRPGEVAVVLRGGRGVGKSFFAKQFGKLFGRHFMQISNSGHLVGNFNNHLRDLVLLFADEAFYANDKKHESILKTLVTEEQMAIEAKGVDVEMAPNCIHLIMSSNDIHVIPAGGDERRYFVTDVGENKKQDSGYFKTIADQMSAGGYEALLHYLRTYDLSDFKVQNVPKTDALFEQKLLSLEPVAEWWYQRLIAGATLRTEDVWLTQVSSTALTDDYIEEVKRFNTHNRGSATAMGRFLRRVCPELSVVQKTVDVEIPTENGWSRKVSRRVRFYMIPGLDECRAAWDKQYGETTWESVTND